MKDETSVSRQFSESLTDEEGAADGVELGRYEGEDVGERVGAEDGAAEGLGVGLTQRHRPPYPLINTHRSPGQQGRVSSKPHRLPAASQVFGGSVG